MKVIEVDFDLSTTFNLNVVVERNLRCPLYCCEQCDQMSSLFFNIWPITSMKICPMAYKICQSRLKSMQYTQKTFEILPIWRKFAKSDRTGCDTHFDTKTWTVFAPLLKWQKCILSTNIILLHFSALLLCSLLWLLPQLLLSTPSQSQLLLMDQPPFQLTAQLRFTPTLYQLTTTTTVSVTDTGKSLTKYLEFTN